MEAKKNACNTQGIAKCVTAVRSEDLIILESMAQDFGFKDMLGK